MLTDRLTRGIAGLGGLFFVAFGLWAVIDPRSFFERLATFPPYNVHLLHDIGAFQIGMGFALLIALVRSDSVFVALAAVGIGQGVHAAAHIADRDLGGNPQDPVVMTALAALLLIAALVRFRSLDRAPQ